MLVFNVNLRLKSLLLRRNSKNTFPEYQINRWSVPTLFAIGEFTEIIGSYGVYIAKRGFKNQ